MALNKAKEKNLCAQCFIPKDADQCGVEEEIRYETSPKAPTRWTANGWSDYKKRVKIARTSCARPSRIDKVDELKPTFHNPIEVE